ncbi:MAG: hypothetical protein FD123_3595 [Bacteroidetes bacterium]|nr:MAG: hypothetical protein FD123_3595 [Bacteroidota bacterium]
MKKSLFILAASAGLLAGATAFTLFSNDWTPVTDQAKVSFEMPNEGTAGTLGGLKTTISFNPANPAESKIEATVDPSTINTGVEGKDTHIKSADFFDVAKYPTIRFVSEKVTATAAGFIATGKLTIKDSVKTVDIPFTFEPKGDNEGVFKGHMEIFYGDFGVNKKSKSGKDKVKITIEVPVKK